MQARARENNRGGQSLFLQSAYKTFSFVNRSYLLLMCGWGWRGSGCVAAAAGSACVCGGGGGLNSDSLKREKESCYKNSHCLFKQKAWLLSVGWKFFFAIKEAS